MRSSTPNASSSASIRRKPDSEHAVSTSPVRRRTPSAGTRSSSLDSLSNNTSAEQFPNTNNHNNTSNFSNNNNTSATDGTQNSSTYYPPEFGSLHDVFLRSTQFRQFFEDTLTGETIATEIVEESIVGPVLQRIVTQTCDDLSVPWTVQWFVAQMNEVALMYLTELEGKTTTATTRSKSSQQKNQSKDVVDPFSRQKNSFNGDEDDDDDDVESSILGDDDSDDDHNHREDITKGSQQTKPKRKIHQIEPIRPILVPTTMRNNNATDVHLEGSSSQLAQKNSTGVYCSPITSESANIPSIQRDDNSIFGNFVENLDNNSNKNQNGNPNKISTVHENRHVHLMEESDHNNTNNFIFTGFASNADEINQKPKRVREPTMLDEDSWCRGSIKTVPRKEKPSQPLDPENNNNSQVEANAHKSNTSNNNTSRSSNVRSRSNSASGSRTKNNNKSPTIKKSNNISNKNKDSDLSLTSKQMANQTPDHLAGNDGVEEEDISIIPGLAEFESNNNNNNNNSKITRPFSAKVGSLSRPPTAATSGQNNASSFVSRKIDSVRGISSAATKVTMPNLLPKNRASLNHNNNNSSSTPSSVLRLMAADNTNQTAANSNFLSLDEETLRNMTSSARAEYETEKEFQQGIQERNQIMNQLRETSKSADEVIIQHNSNTTTQNAIPSVFTARPQTPIFIVDKVASAPNLNLSSVNLGGGTSLSGVYNMTMTTTGNVNNKSKHDVSSVPNNVNNNNNNNNSSLISFSDPTNHPQSAKAHRDANNSKSMIFINITDEKELQEARMRLEADEKEALRLAKMKSRRVPLGGGGGSRPSSSLSKLMRGGDSAAAMKAPSPDLFFVPEKKPGAAGSASMIRNIVPAAGVTSKIVDQSTK